MTEPTFADVEGRVAKQVGGCGYFAAVRVRVDPRVGSTIQFAPSAVEDYNRGLGWPVAADFGARLGLELAGASGCCVITQIHGMVCDTSPTLVAIAAMRAVWSAVGFNPTADLAEHVEALVLQGHRLSLEQLASGLRG